MLDRMWISVYANHDDNGGGVNLMLIAERRRLITDRLQATTRVVVNELSVEYGVSEETIRRDLEWLEKEGIATRTYGGAILNHNDKVAPPYAIRKNTNVEGKIHIAQQVAEMLRDGDTIMVDESSTAAYAVRAIRHLKDLTIITNSQEIINEMSGQENWQVISTGGYLKTDVMALVGHHAMRTIESYHVKYTILSCRGINTQLGIADSSDDVVQIKRAMMEACDCTILLADHRKFDRTGFVALGNLKEIDRLVTDQEPSADWKARFEEEKIDLYYKNYNNK